jgi:hypothetical protein
MANYTKYNGGPLSFLRTRQVSRGVPAVAGFLFGKAAVPRRRKSSNPVSIKSEQLLVKVMVRNYKGSVTVILLSNSVKSFI